MAHADDGPRKGWPLQQGEMAERIRNHDWQRTPLGPLEGWPATLRNAVDLMLDSPLPACLAWGPEHTCLYNEGMKSFVAERHPRALGEAYSRLWPEHWSEHRAVVEALMAGESRELVCRAASDGSRPHRPSRPVAVSFTPLRDERSAVAGFFGHAREQGAAGQPGGSASKYRVLLDAIDQGYCIIEMIFDAGDRPVDFRFLEVNAAFERQTGLGDVVGKTMRSLAPDHEEHWFEIYGRIARTGVPERFENVAATIGRYFEVYAFRLPEAGRATVGVLFNDISERRHSQQAMRESEENLRLVVENTRNYAIFTTDPKGDVTAWYVGAETVFGYRPADIIGRNAAILFTPEDRAAGEPERELAVARQNDSSPNVRWHMRADGSRVFIEGTVVALWGGAGELRGFLKVGQDVTERERVQDELRASRRQLTTLLEGIPQLVWRSRDDGDWTWASPQWEAFTGQSVEASRGSGWLDVVHPADREGARSAWSQSRDQQRFHADYRIREAATGRYRWFQTRATPSRESDGAIVEWFGTSTDVDDLWRLREHERLLLAELQHRVRNTLAVIRSIARRTADTTDTAEDYAMHLEGRINAFARVQAAVTRDPLGGVSLLDLVAEELIAATAREGENATLEGPNVRLSGREAEIFGLAIHELATNAIKFGALSEPAGRISIRWSIEETENQPILHFVWKEKGLHLDPEEPRRRGFGTELLERTLSYQLLGEGKASFEQDGVRCVIRMPLPMQMDGYGVGPYGAAAPEH